MKITKSYLQQVIKEELEKINEGIVDQTTDFFQRLIDAIKGTSSDKKTEEFITKAPFYQNLLAVTNQGNDFVYKNYSKLSGDNQLGAYDNLAKGLFTVGSFSQSSGTTAYSDSAPEIISNEKERLVWRAEFEKMLQDLKNLYMYKQAVSRGQKEQIRSYGDLLKNAGYRVQPAIRNNKNVNDMVKIPGTQRSKEIIYSDPARKSKTLTPPIKLSK